MVRELTGECRALRSLTKPHSISVASGPSAAAFQTAAPKRARFNVAATSLSSGVIADTGLPAVNARRLASIGNSAHQPVESGGIVGDAWQNGHAVDADVDAGVAQASQRTDA